jgi:hypothetical protein
MYLVLSLSIFTLSNSFFYLFWWSKVSGVFNTSDIGLFILAASLFFTFLMTPEKRIIRNSISLLIVFQLLFCLFHIYFVVLKYNYSLFNSIVASRSFLYYCSFFLFLLLLDTRRKAVNTLNALNVINYFGPTVFHHEWAAGHNARAGVKRAFIPGMSILSMTAVWSFACMYASGFAKMSWNIQSMTYIAGHIFRQSRMRLFGVLLCLLAMGFYQRRFFMLVVALGMVGLSSLILQEVLEVDLLGQNVTLTVEDVTKSKGTFRSRMAFIQEAFKEYMESPIVGTGGSAIRAFRGAYEGVDRQQLQLFHILGKQTDIGILNWVKDFGLVGLAWVITFFTHLSRLALRALRDPAEDRRLALFCAFFLFFVMATSLTLEHLINAETIPPVMFVSAILVRMRLGWREEEAPASSAGMPPTAWGYR